VTRIYGSSLNIAIIGNKSASADVVKGNIRNRAMPHRSILCTLVILFSLPAARAQVLTLHRASGPILIDGIIDAAWSEADSTGEFFQLQPYPGQPPSRRTTAKVLSTDDALYCLIICYDSHGTIQSLTGLTDDGGGDIVSIMLDTFNDRQTAYKFAVSAGGVRADCRLLDDGRNRDYSWDGIWFASSQVYDWGFVVEMRIPYKSLRTDPTMTSWGLDFDRWIPESKEDLYWCTYEKNEGQRISKFGRLILNGLRPQQHGLNLEVYPVGLLKGSDLQTRKGRINGEAGIDVFYNPSEALTFQLTANPDFAQIEADPYAFNISRYETYFSEQRPFFTEGKEIFMAAGRERNSGFYQPLELLYTRRIGKILPDGSQVPLVVGSKATGRTGDWSYGAFYALTGEKDYVEDEVLTSEQTASYVALRAKRTIFENSSIGVLATGKFERNGDGEGVIDVDGAFRTSEIQLAYQFARSFSRGKGDYAASVGLRSYQKNWMTGFRARAIGKEFQIDQVGFVPWKGTAEIVAFTGPMWFFDTGSLSQLSIYGGGGLGYEDADLYWDHIALLGVNCQFRANWGLEIDATAGRSRDGGVLYDGFEIDYSSWWNIAPEWNANLNGGFARTYNFDRNYLAPYRWVGLFVSWRPAHFLELGTTANVWSEGKPSGGTEDNTIDARPYFSATPVNGLNLKVYVDNVYTTGSSRIQNVQLGVLISYNFLPKSWVYAALNERRERPDDLLRLTDRAAVIKVKYLYYM
jgi:hypothetical protein